MNNTERVLGQFEAYPLVPVFYADDEQYCLDILKSAYAGGIRVFEFVNRGSKALNNFKILKAHQQAYMPDLLLGVGTIMYEKDAIAFVEAGSEFLISPVVCENIAAIADEAQCCWIPGCMTPTEIYRAAALNAKLVKLFPAEVLGVSFLKAVKSLFPGISFMPTGGVQATKDGVLLWKNAGVHAVGLGSSLFAVDSKEEAYSKIIADRCQYLLTCLTQ